MLSLKLSAFDEAYDWLCKFQSLWNNPLNSSTPSSSKSADNLSLHRFFASAFSNNMRTSKFQFMRGWFWSQNRSRKQDLSSNWSDQGNSYPRIATTALLKDQSVESANRPMGRSLQNELSPVQVHMVANRPGSCIFSLKIQFQSVPARGTWTQVYCSPYGWLQISFSSFYTGDYMLRGPRKRT